MHSITHRTRRLFFLSLFTDLLCKGFSSLVRINCSYLVQISLNQIAVTLYEKYIYPTLYIENTSGPN